VKHQLRLYLFSDFYWQRREATVWIPFVLRNFVVYTW